MTIGLRGRLTLLVTGAAVVLASVSILALLLLLPRLQASVVDQVLRERVVEVTADLATGSRVSDPLTQVLDEDAKVVLGLGEAPLVSGEQVSTVTARGLSLDVNVPDLGGPLRVLATPLDSTVDGVSAAAGRTLVVAVHLGPLDALTDRVTTILSVLAGLLVLTAAVAAWILTGAVLRPVAAMTQAAARIGSRPGTRRLPRPGTLDEIDRLAGTFNSLLERVDAGVRRERAFVDDASHELHTPLTVLRGELELAADEPDPAQVRRGVVAALGAVERLSALAESLLVLARLDDGTSHRPTPMDLVACARQAALGTPGLAVTVTVLGQTSPDATSSQEGSPADSVVVFGDRIALERAVGNLLRNALDAGATRARVTITATDRAPVGPGNDQPRPGDATAAPLASVLIDVEDDGPGFPPSFLPRAFERFARADDARGTSGSGLGLAIIAAVAKNHGGDVAADNLSELGGGRVRTRLVTTAHRDPRSTADPTNP
ncbi:MAG: ATP-binding protein [Dermatophilaceae bacterium]